MTEELTASEVREWAQELEFDPAHMQMRTEMQARHHDLVAMNEIPDLPSWMTSGGDVVAHPSPLLGDLADVILADMRPYNTDVSSVPLGKEYQKQADEEEKWLALWRAQANDGWRVSGDLLWHSLLSHYAVALFRVLPDVNKDAEGNPIKGKNGWVSYPWEITVPDPQTCFFPVTGAPIRPKVLARRYEALVRDIERDFSGAPGLYQDRQFKWSKGGQWSYEKLSDDYVYGRMPGSYTGSAKRGERCEFIELYTPNTTYLYAQNRSGMKGELVWSGPNHAGGVPCVITSGLVTPQREESERLQPAFRAIYQMVKAINRVRARRGSRSENLKGDLVNLKGPGTLAAESEFGVNDTFVDDAGIGPRRHTLHGEQFGEWNPPPDLDLDKLEESLWKELERYINNWRQLSDPEVIKDARVNVYLNAVESTHRRQSRVTSNHDYVWRELMKMAEASVEALDHDFPLYATSEVRFGQGKKISAGELVTIGPKGVTYPHSLLVSTKSTSEAEQRMRREDEQQKRIQGVGTLDGLISVDSDDLLGSYEALAVDQMYAHTGSTFGTQQVDQYVSELLVLSAGAYIQAGPPMAPDAAAPAGGAGNSPMRPPAIPGTAGGAAA